MLQTHSNAIAHYAVGRSLYCTLRVQVNVISSQNHYCSSRYRKTKMKLHINNLATLSCLYSVGGQTKASAGSYVFNVPYLDAIRRRVAAYVCRDTASHNDNGCSPTRQKQLQASGITTIARGPRYVRATRFYTHTNSCTFFRLGSIRKVVSATDSRTIFFTESEEIIFLFCYC